LQRKAGPRRIVPAADLSEADLAKSYGVVTNYLYELDRTEGCRAALAAPRKPIITGAIGS